MLLGLISGPGICLGFVGSPRDIFGFDFCPRSVIPVTWYPEYPQPLCYEHFGYKLLPFAARRVTKKARNLYVEFWDPTDLSSHWSPLLAKEYALPKQFTKIKKTELKLTYILTPARASTDLLIKARRAKWQKTVMIPFSTILKEYKGRRITDPLRKQTL